MESRRIRDEQDRAFEECLEADRAKVCCVNVTLYMWLIAFIQLKEEEKRKQLEIEEGDKRKETLWLQVNVNFNTLERTHV